VSVNDRAASRPGGQPDKAPAGRGRVAPGEATQGCGAPTRGAASRSKALGRGEAVARQTNASGRGAVRPFRLTLEAHGVVHDTADALRVVVRVDGLPTAVAFLDTQRTEVRRTISKVGAEASCTVAPVLLRTRLGRPPCVRKCSRSQSPAPPLQKVNSKRPTF